MAIEVVAYDPGWPGEFRRVAAVLRAALAGVPASVEHVGSTAVPGLAAKPILDIDVIVAAEDVPAAVAALEAVGYTHRGDLGVVGREAFHAPDEDPRRHVYVCTAGTLHVRNHLAVRNVLRRDRELREEYGGVKAALADDPEMTIERYLAGKSAVLQKVLAASDLSAAELREIHRLNDPWVIRPLREADAEAMVDLHTDVWEQTYTGLIDPRILQRRRDERDERVERWRRIARTGTPEARTWVAERTGERRLLGFASAGPARDEPSEGLPEVELWALYVRSELHGQGLGYALLSEAIGVRPAYLWVLDGNTRAIAFYERQGFRFDGCSQTEEIGLEHRMVRGE